MGNVKLTAEVVGTSDPSVIVDLKATADGYLIVSPASGLIFQSDIQIGNFVAENGFRYPTDTSGGPITVTVAAGFQVGQCFRVVDVASSWSTNNLTVDFISSGYTFQGLSQNYVGNVSNNGQTFCLDSPGNFSLF